MTNKAVVLVSGGIDSATCLAIATEQFDKVIPVHYDYGQQTSEFEQAQAENLVGEAQEADEAEVDDLHVVNYEPVFSHFAGGVASDRDEFVTEDGELEEEDGRSTGYVPMRNLHLIGTGSAFADIHDADAVFHGMQAGDEESYPDCRENFRLAVQDAVNFSLADGEEVNVEAPLVSTPKHEVIELGDDLGVPWEYTYSCYEAIETDLPEPCGKCPACLERAEGFLEADVTDPFGTIDAVEENTPEFYEELMEEDEEEVEEDTDEE